MKLAAKIVCRVLFILLALPTTFSVYETLSEEIYHLSRWYMYI